jgi:pilus assembly protein CpaC
MAVVPTCNQRPTSGKRRFRTLLCGLFVASCSTVGLVPTNAWGQSRSPSSQWLIANEPVDVDQRSSRQSIEMIVNTSREITSDQIIKQVRIHNDQIIKARPLQGGNRLQLSAGATGVTQVDLITDDDSTHSIEVMVVGDVRELEAILKNSFPDASLEIHPIQEKAGCIVSGFVTSDEHVEQVIRIVELYFPTVINKVSVTGVHTIQLETQIMEVSRTKLRQLGIDWAFGDDRGTIGMTKAAGVLTGENGIMPFPEGNVNQPRRFLGGGTETAAIGIAHNSTRFLTAINALRENNLIKVLASPTLTAIDGRPASFNVGGEIPIAVPAGLGQVGIQFREYGTRLDYVAKVRDNGQIRLEVRPYVSELDPSQQIFIEGRPVSGFRSRYLETGVELGAGQTLVLGGLLQMRTEAINRGIPGLSDMPWIGSLFRLTLERQNEIELLVTITPNFAGPMDPCEVPAITPGTNSQSPTDTDLYWRGHIETPLNDYPANEGQLPPAANMYPGGGYESVPAGAAEGAYQGMNNAYGTPGQHASETQSGMEPSYVPLPDQAATGYRSDSGQVARQPNDIGPEYSTDGARNGSSQEEYPGLIVR